MAPRRQRGAEGPADLPPRRVRTFDLSRIHANEPLGGRLRATTVLEAAPHPGGIGAVGAARRQLPSPLSPSWLPLPAQESSLFLHVSCVSAFFPARAAARCAQSRGPSARTRAPGPRNPTNERSSTPGTPHTRGAGADHAPRPGHCQPNGHLQAPPGAQRLWTHAGPRERPPQPPRSPLDLAGGGFAPSQGLTGARTGLSFCLPSACRLLAALSPARAATRGPP
jgi:hypothetical protein